MNFKVTLFNAIDSNRIESKYSDGSFLFNTIEIKSLKDIFEVLKSNFYLSRHLDNKEVIKEKLTDLESYYSGRITSLGFRISIKNMDKLKEVIKYFKDNKYSSIIYSTKEFDKIYDFSVNVFMKVNLTNDNTANSFIKKISNDLNIQIDSSYNALVKPSKESVLIHIRENGKIILDSDIELITNDDIPDSINYKKDISPIIEICFNIFKEKGYDVIFDKKYFLIKDKQKLYFNPKSPFIAKSDKSDFILNIKSDLLKSKEGKQFFKDKNKRTQVKELLKPIDTSIYKKYLFTNERYLDFSDKNKIEIIKNFINSEKGILKIKSGMGTAKSNGIKYVIEEAHKKNLRVIILSSRISVALDFADKYGLMLYQDFGSINSNDSLIVQFDSLHKYDISKYDIVIFDEFMSLLLHHRSNLSNNTNINAIKFKSLLENKKVLVADAFLTGYEDMFFINREMYGIFNTYRDDISLFEYTNKDYFVSTIIESCKNLNDNEHISVSVSSMNIMKLLDHELSNLGIKVICLSSETSELTRDIIYKRFKEENHSSYQVIVYTPTLTVGVSNLNNIVKHFHYDSGMSMDVISSLQMIKRSRITPEIHYYIEERERSLETDVSILTSTFENSINSYISYYKDRDKTLLIEVDKISGEFVLTDLARYINKIESLYNILETNHASSFRLLLSHQFISEPVIIEEKSKNIDITKKVRLIKDNERLSNIALLEKYSLKTDEQDIQELQLKISEKTEEEKFKLMVHYIKSEFSKELPEALLKNLIKFQIESDFKFINYIKNMKIVQSSNLDSFARYELSKAISSDIGSLQYNKNIKFLEYVISLKSDFILENTYSKEDINNIDYNIGTRKFERFLLDLGYKYNKDRKEYVSDNRIYKFLDFI